jgi:DNA-binding response OmpR family regulator
LARAARPELPVILITGRDLTEKAMAAAQGGQGFFRKPFNGQELLAAVSRALSASA